MTHPRSAFGAPPQGGAASGRSEPVRGVRSMIQIHAKEVAFGAIEG